jgi:hypothetical protein
LALFAEALGSLLLSCLVLEAKPERFLCFVFPGFDTCSNAMTRQGLMAHVSETSDA